MAFTVHAMMDLAKTKLNSRTIIFVHPSSQWEGLMMVFTATPDNKVLWGEMSFSAAQGDTPNLTIVEPNLAHARIFEMMGSKSIQEGCPHITQSQQRQHIAVEIRLKRGSGDRLPAQPISHLDWRVFQGWITLRTTIQNSQFKGIGFSHGEHKLLKTLQDRLWANLLEFDRVQRINIMGE